MNSKLIGSILIIAGTAIGGGMLAMPIISSGVGFPGISLILILIWIAMCYTSMLLVDCYKHHSHTDGLNTMTRLYLGKVGSIITGIAMLTLMYALVSAYIAGGTNILHINLMNLLNLEISPRQTAVVFTVIFGGIVALGAKIVDITTKWIFFIKLLFLLIIILTMVGFINIDYLATTPLEQKLLYSSIPIIFTSFGFHIVVPSMVKYLNGDQVLLKKAFFYGSLLPLVVYLIWEMSILGSIEPHTFFQIIQDNKGLEGMILAISSLSESSWMQIPINVFTAAAILTSLLGVALALFDYIKDLTKNVSFINNRFILFLITFVPPLIFALYYPQGFILALSYAAISVVVTSLFIPVFMYIRVKKARGEKISVLNKISFTLIICFGIGILIIQTLMSIGKLPILD